MRSLRTKARIFWPLLLVVFLADCSSKELAVEALGVPGESRDLLGEVVRLTLVYNTGSAMGLLGSWSRELLGLAGVAAAVLFFTWYRRAPVRDHLMAAATAFLMAGALGNAWQRLLAPRGVVDFIDIGLGATRFWVFNIADIAVYVGAGLLLLASARRTRSHPVT